jgi:acyl-CoA thioesterase
MENNAIKKIIEEDPFLKYVGIKVLSLNGGHCKLSIDFRQNLTRLGGMLNGGAIATLADAAGGCSVLTLNNGSNQVTVKLDVSFLKPINSGPVVAEAKVKKSGKNLSFADIEIFDGDGVLCATASGIWFFIGDLK